jgi:hypothetical protein
MWREGAKEGLKMAYEVKFRGENENQLLGWKPSEAPTFECSAMEARVRYEELVRAGVEGNEVDGVVPYVVEIVEISYSKCEGEDRRIGTPVLWQNAEQGAVPEGLWTCFEPSGVSVGVA